MSGAMICRRCGERVNVELTAEFRTAIRFDLEWILEMEAIMDGHTDRRPQNFNCRCLPPPKPAGDTDHQ